MAYKIGIIGAMDVEVATLKKDDYSKDSVSRVNGLF